MAEGYDVNISLDGTMKRLIPYMASGIRADYIEL